MHESYSYLSVAHTLPAGELSVRPNNNSVMPFLIHPLSLLCLAPVCHQCLTLYTLNFYLFPCILPVEQKAENFLKRLSLFLSSVRLKRCKWEVKQAGMKFPSSVFVNIFTGFPSDLLPAISTFENVTRRPLGENKPPYCKGSSKISDNASLGAHTHTPGLITGHGLQAIQQTLMRVSDLCI